MLQDIPIQPRRLREASSCVLETERLTLRRPTLADVKAIARLANDRRIAENTRRLPHPYPQDHAVEFVRATAADSSETVFLIEQNYSPIGMVGIDRQRAGRAGTRLLARRRALGPGFRHRSRARGDRFLLRGIRCRAPDRGRPRRQPGVAQHPGEMRLPVERRRAAPLRGAGLLDPGRLLPPVARRLVVAEELGRVRRGGSGRSRLRNNRCRPCERRDPYSAAVMGYKRSVYHSCPQERARGMGPCERTSGCTHLRNRLKNKHLADRRFHKRMSDHH